MIDNPVIGLHNALTCYRPATILGRLTTFAWRCQSRGALLRAINAEIRFYDIRLTLHKGRWYAAHGAIRIDVDPINAISLIASHIPDPIIRLILERGDPQACRAFVSLAESLQRAYPHVMFIGGNHKPTWKKLIHFERDAIGDTAFQCVGSMDPHPLGRIVGYLSPRLWTRLFRRTDPRRSPLSSAPYQLYDFLL